MPATYLPPHQFGIVVTFKGGGMSLTLSTLPLCVHDGGEVHDFLLLKAYRWLSNGLQLAG